MICTRKEHFSKTPLSENTVSLWILTCFHLYQNNKERGNIYLPLITASQQGQLVAFTLTFVALQTPAHFSEHPLKEQYRLLSNSCQFTFLKWVLITQLLSESCIFNKGPWNPKIASQLPPQLNQ